MGGRLFRRVSVRGVSGKGRLVWSSERGDQRTETKEQSEPAASLPPTAQNVRVRREKAGRGGKAVTVVGPLVLVRDDAAALLAGWKKLCGSGGTLRPARSPASDTAFEIEIQGDHADRLVAELARAGYKKVKRAGG